MAVPRRCCDLPPFPPLSSSLVFMRNLDSDRLIALGSLRRQLAMIMKNSYGLRVLVYRRWLLPVRQSSQCCDLHLVGHGRVGALVLFCRSSSVFMFTSSCLPVPDFLHTVLSTEILVSLCH
ncbi:hypothetical protein Bca4012_095835 [Brassica carinata]